jgi:hypothetical protein
MVFPAMEQLYCTKKMPILQLIENKYYVVIIPPRSFGIDTKGVHFIDIEKTSQIAPLLQLSPPHR